MTNTLKPNIVRLQASWYWSKMSDGVLIGSCVQDRRYLIRYNPTVVEGLLKILEQGLPKNSLVEHLSNELQCAPRIIEKILERLKTCGSLVENHDGENPQKLDSKNRYYSQVQYLRLFESSEFSAVALHERLQNRKILFVGVGGYGSWAMLNCARIGIRNIMAIDPDVVEPSNLSRQVLYRDSDIGDFKINACKRAIQSENPDVNFEGHIVAIKKSEDMIPYLQEVDLVLNCFGYRSNPVLTAVAQASGSMDIPSILYGGAWVGPLNIPGETACYNCLLQQPAIMTIVSHSYGPLHYRQEIGGQLCPRVSIPSCIVAWETVRFLSGMDEPPTKSGIVMLDLFGYKKQTFYKVERLPHCSVCREWNSKKIRSHRRASDEK